MSEPETEVLRVEDFPDVITKSTGNPMAEDEVWRRIHEIRTRGKRPVVVDKNGDKWGFTVEADGQLRPHELADLG